MRFFFLPITKTSVMLGFLSPQENLPVKLHLDYTCLASKAEYLALLQNISSQYFSSTDERTRSGAVFSPEQCVFGYSAVSCLSEDEENDEVFSPWVSLSKHQAFMILARIYRSFLLKCGSQASAVSTCALSCNVDIHSPPPTDSRSSKTFQISHNSPEPFPLTGTCHQRPEVHLQPPWCSIWWGFSNMQSSNRICSSIQRVM